MGNLKYFLPLLSVLLLTGCGDRHELNDLAVASALSIDKKGSNYLVGVQLINPDSVRGKKSGESPVFTYTGEGETVDEAIKEIQYQLPRYLFLSDLRLVVLSEEVARSKFNSIVDLLLRDPRIRSDFIFMISKGGRAVEDLSELTPMDEVPAEFLFYNLTDYAQGKAIFRNRTLNTIVRDREVKDILLPGIKVVGDKQQDGGNEKKLHQAVLSSRLVVQDSAIFRHSQFVGWANENENKAIRYLLSSEADQNLTVKIPQCEESISIVVEDTTVAMDAKIKNGRPKISIKIDVKGYIGNTNCKIANSPSVVTSIKREIERQINLDVKKGVRGILKKYRADIFGFGWMLEMKNLNEWKKIRSNWSKQLENLEVNIEVDAALSGMGQIFNPIQP